MSISSILFPCRCPFCLKVISENSISCEDCANTAQIKQYKRTFKNGCECVSAYAHEGVWRKSVLMYKYHGYKQFSVQFSLVLKELAEASFSDVDFDIFVPVPMHKSKRRERGFDQVELLCRKTAKLLGAKSQSVLVQTKLNRSQHELSESERFKNVKGIYSCKNSEAVRGKNILLFDDIVTTGATLLECSNVLLEHGAAKVCCITVNTRLSGEALIKSSSKVRAKPSGVI